MLQMLQPKNIKNLYDSFKWLFCFIRTTIMAGQPAPHKTPALVYKGLWTIGFPVSLNKACY